MLKKQKALCQRQGAFFKVQKNQSRTLKTALPVCISQAGLCNKVSAKAAETVSRGSPSGENLCHFLS